MGHKQIAGRYFTPKCCLSSQTRNHEQVVHKKDYHTRAGARQYAASGSARYDGRLRLRDWIQVKPFTVD